MLRKSRINARTSILAVFFAFTAAMGPAYAQDGIIQRLGSAVDTLRKYVDSFGRKTEEILPPAISLDGAISDTFSGLKTHMRQYDETFPVPPGARVAIEAEFGEVRVTAWDQPIVRVQADITVGAETAEQAMQVANGIQVGATPHEGGLDLRTQLPDAPVEIIYIVSVPGDANVACRNRLGDTIIHGVGGDVTVESTLGRVELKDLARPVKVWAQGGAQPLFAFGLRQGGDFALRDMQAEFINVAGTLVVNSFMGKVTLRELAPECRIEASSTGGPIEVHLSPNDRPSIEAAALYGEIASDLELNRTPRSNLVLASTQATESPQHLRLDTTFDNIAVRVEGMPPAPALAQAPTGGHVQDNIPETNSPAPPGMRLVIDAIVGDVRVEGVDGDTLSTSATKLVRVETPSNAQPALEALVLDQDGADGVIRVSTAMQKDPLELGCTSHRIDLVIACPRTMPLEIRARNGHTTVVGMTGPVKVDQVEGSILVQQAAGDVDLHNSKGEIEALDCAGAIVIDSNFGRASTRNAKGRQNITCRQGKVVVDAPLGELNVRGYGGDVNVIALNGVAGNFDVGVEQGNLSIMLLPTSDALLVATAEGGRVDVNNANGLVLTGTVAKDTQQFQGRMNGGQFSVILKTKGGNIAID